MAEIAPQAKIPILDPTGTVRQIDPSEYQLAIDQHGFQPVSPEMLKQHELQQQYGEGLGQELKAFGEGAARGASFGLSDQALTRSGIVEPEALRARQEFNPVSSGLGEVAGVVAPSLLTGGAAAPEAVGASALRRGVGEAASVVGAPMKGVSSAGKYITESLGGRAATKATADAAAEAATPGLLGAAGISNPILKGAISHGVGSAVEGAAFGLGQSVSEEALGDPDLNAEKVLSNIGFNAMLGGTFGAAFGGGAAAIEKVKGSLHKPVSQADQALVKSGDFEASVRASELPEAEKAGVFSSLRGKKPDAHVIQGIGGEYGLPVLEGQVSSSEVIQRAEDFLLSGQPTVASIGRQELASQGFSKAEKIAAEAIGTGSGLSEHEAGSSIRKSLHEDILKEGEPFEAAYAEANKYNEHIGISDRSLGQVSRNIADIEAVRVSGNSPQAKLARGILQDIEDGRIKTLQDLRARRIQFQGELSPTASPAERHVQGLILDKLKGLEERSLKRFAENEMKSPVAREKVLSSLDKLKSTNKEYGVFKEKLNTLADGLGTKAGGAKTLAEKIENMNAQSIARKIFSERNVEFAQDFAKHFPKQMEIIKQYQIGQLVEKASKKGFFDIKVAMKEINGMEKETRELLFSKSQLKTIGDMHKYIDSFPKKFNPSGTAYTEAFQDAFKHGVSGSIIANARDYALQKLVKTSVNLSEATEATAKVHTLTKLERAANTVTKSIETGSKAIFSVAKGGVQAAASQPDLVAKNDYHEAVKQVQDMVETPQKALDKMEGATQWIYQAAPKHAGAIQMASMRAATFLNSKIPKNPNPKPLGPKYMPSPAETAKFMRYYKTIQTPTSVLRSVKMGMLSIEQMDALHNVYPSLLGKMQASVMDQMTHLMGKDKGATIPYAVKMSLSMFLGQDLVQSLEPAQIANMQLISQGGGQAQADREMNQAVKVSQTGLSNLSLSQRSQTNLQDIASRNQG